MTKQLEYFDSPVVVDTDDVWARSLDESNDAEGRTLTVRVVPYGTIGNPTPRTYERVARGAFTKTAQERAEQIPLTLGHMSTGGPQIGISRGFQDRSDGLYGNFIISDTSAGRDALALLHDRALHSVSMGFQPHRTGTFTHERKQGVEIKEASLHHLALLGVQPAYKDAVPISLREQEDDHDEASRKRLLFVERERLYLLRNS